MEAGICVHPEAPSGRIITGKQTKPSLIPVPVYKAWKTDDFDQQTIHGKSPDHAKKGSPIRSISAPISPKHCFPSISPHVSPSRSLIPKKVERNPAKIHSDDNEPQSMPTSPKSIKSRYDMRMASVTESIASSEFSSTIKLEESPDHHMQIKDEAANLPQHSLNPSVLYPLTPSTYYRPILYHESSIQEDKDSSLSVSSVSIPSKVSLASEKEDGQLELDLTPPISTSSTMKSSQFDIDCLSSDDALAVKFLLTGHDSGLSESKIRLLEQDKEVLLKDLEDSLTTTQFLEEECRTLKEKASGDELKISELELKIAQLEEQADKLRFENHNQKILKEANEEKQQQDLLNQLTELIKQRDMLNGKLLTIEKEHALCGIKRKMTASTNDETEKQLLTLKSDFHSSQQRVEYLQDALKSLEKSKQEQEQCLEQEKGRVNELQVSLDSVSSSMSTITNEVERLHSEKEELTHLLQKKDDAVLSLEKELNYMKHEKEKSVVGLQSTEEEKAELRSSIDQLKQDLTESRQNHINSQLKIRELGQKFSATECQLREQEAFTVTVSKEKEILNTELQEQRKKNQELEQILAKKTVALTMQEKELASITVEKQTAELKAAENEASLKSSEMSRANEMQHLTTQITRLKLAEKHTHQQLEEGDRALKCSQAQQTSLQCSLKSEREQKATLALQVTGLKEELSSLQKQYQQLKDHNQEMEAATEKKSRTSQENENSLRQQLHEKGDYLKQKEDELHSAGINLKQMETELERLKARIIELQTHVALSNADVENHKKLSENLKSKLELIQEAKQQEISELKLQVEAKRSEITKLNSKLNAVHSEMKNLDQLLEESNKTLEIERKALNAVQSQLSSSEANSTELSSHLSALEEQIKMQACKNETLINELSEAETKINTQEQELKQFQEKLNEATIREENKRSKNAEMIVSLNSRHQEEMQKLKEENESIQRNNKRLDQELGSTQEALRSSQAELKTTRTQLLKMEEECKKLLSSVKTETSCSSELAKKLAVSESQYNDSCLQVQELQQRIKLAQEKYDEIQDQLKESQGHCSTLQQELKVKEKLSITSERKMEEKLGEVIAQSEKRIEDARKTNEKLEVTIQKLSEEVSQMMVENGSLKSKVDEKGALCQQLKHKIAENNAKDIMSQNRISELEKRILDEVELKAAVKKDLTSALERQKDLDLKLSELQKKLSSVIARKESIGILYEEEKFKVETLNQEIKATEAELSKVQNTLLKERESKAELKHKWERDVSGLKQKCHAEIKAMKEKNKELQTEVHLLKASCASKTATVEKLQASCDDLAINVGRLQTEVDMKQETLKEKKDLVNTLTIRNQSLESQLSQLRLEVSALAKSQLDFEECKKQMESASREELQRVLKEVTEHMEQQHSAHHHLEKLRRENESIALKEKDRQIDQLKSQLKRKKQELKKNRLHIEALEIEANFMKSQQQDNAKTRHKIENHLGKISHVLSGSANTSFTVPCSSSTPITSRCSSFQ